MIRWFVPAVLAVAALTVLGWLWWGPGVAHALTAAVAVLIIACPCALGLATPMSVVVGMGKGAGVGVLIRDAEALEVLERVDTLVVDKTGTLTKGRPELTDLTPSAGFEPNEVLALIAAVEAKSEHPIADAIAAAADASRSAAAGAPTVRHPGAW